MRQSLLHAVPDLPRWVELRASLLHGAPTILGSAAGAAVVTHEDELFLFGVPDLETLRRAAALDPGAEVIASRETLAALGVSGLGARRVVLHTLPPGQLLIAAHPTVVLGRGDTARIASVPAELRAELEEALQEVPVAATELAGALVAFCYPGAPHRGALGHRRRHPGGAPPPGRGILGGGTDDRARG